MSLDVPNPPWLREDRYPFQRQVVEVAGCRVHYVDEYRGQSGDAPTLLLLHGNPTWSFLYRNIIHGVADRFRCVAPDYPGFGLSTARAGYGFTPAEHAAVLEAFLLGLDLRNVVLMVHDWGGPIGLGVVARHPERFRGLVIGNSWAWPLNGQPRFELLARTMGSPAGGWLIRRLNAFVNVSLRIGVCRRWLPPAVMAAYRGPFAQPDAREPTRILARELAASRTYLDGVETGVARLAHLPTLILWGDRDVAFRAAERQRFQRAFPRHQLVPLRGAGHFIQEDAPDQIVAAIHARWDEA